MKLQYIPRFVLNYAIYGFLFMGAAVLIGRSAIPDGGAAVPSGLTECEPPQILIDPGHGGEDGGAEAEGVLEKDLNLAVSECLYDLYALFGIRAEMTRTEDEMLYARYAPPEEYEGHKKSYDLRSRLRMAEESGASLFVSVHMNKFPQESAKGFQVYYSPNTSDSERAAQLIQSYAKKHLDPSNTRDIKRATASIYILKRITIPAVLAECGFLSNPAERTLLQSPLYRLKTASVLFASTTEFLSLGDGGDGETGGDETGGTF